MLYLLDANVLITAKDSYYPVDAVPEFWDWLEHSGNKGNVKIPIEIYEEIKAGPSNADTDLLYAWIQQEHIREALILDEDVNVAKVQYVVSNGYAHDLKDTEVEYIGRDPFLLAYGLGFADRCVVTAEASKPSMQRHKRHVPDVANSLQINHCNPFEFNKLLGFKTNWRSG